MGLFDFLRKDNRISTERSITEIQRFHGHTSWILSVAFSPDGQFALSGSMDSTMRLWDIQVSREHRSFLLKAEVVRTVGVTRDGRSAFSVTTDDAVPLRVWDIRTGQQVLSTRNATSGRNAVFSFAAVSPDCDRLLLSNGETVQLIDVTTSKVVRTFKDIHGHEVVALSPNGCMAVAASWIWSDAILWDTNTGRELGRFQNTSKQKSKSKAGVAMITSLAFDPSGRFVLAGGRDLILLDVNGLREVRRFTGHTQSAMAVSFSPDGRRVLSGSKDKTLRLWDVETGRQLTSPACHEATIRSVAFSPDGKFALSGAGEDDDDHEKPRPIDCTLRLWSLPL